MLEAFPGNNGLAEFMGDGYGIEICDAGWRKGFLTAPVKTVTPTSDFFPPIKSYFWHIGIVGENIWGLNSEKESSASLSRSSSSVNGDVEDKGPSKLKKRDSNRLMKNNEAVS